MREEDLLILKANDHRVLRLHMDDGEIATVKILFVSETEQDIIADLIASSKVERYEKSDVQPAFQYLFKDITWVEQLSDQPGNP